MAISLRKWLGTLKELKWRQDYNENMTDIETAINDLETNNSLLPIHDTVTGSILTYALSLGEAIYFVATGGSTTDLPSNQYRYTVAMIAKRSPTSAIIMAFNYTDGAIATNHYVSSAWSGWVIK